MKKDKFIIKGFKPSYGRVKKDPLLLLQLAHEEEKGGASWKQIEKNQPITP